MKISILIVNVILFLGSCQTKDKPRKFSSTRDEDCAIYYQKYKEAVNEQKVDSALIYIDQAINCDPKNLSFKSNKVRFLINVNKYNEAIDLINHINSDDTSLRMLDAVLKLKIKDTQSIELLQRCFKEYNNEKEIVVDNLIYKIALTNFFNGKEQALKEIESSKKKFTKDYERANLEALEELITKYDKQNVLFKLFGIKQNQ